MLYLFGLIFAALIVTGQTLYKMAVDRSSFEPTISFILSKKMLDLLLSWQFLSGLAVFSVAALLSFWMLTKYQFTTFQAVTVPVVMGLSYVAGTWFFKDQISALNVVGLIVLACGVILSSIR